MLNIIRDNVQSFGVKFIVGLVVVVMAFFGVSTFSSQDSNTLVTIDGYEVKLEKYQRAYESARENIRNKYGKNAAQYLEMINLESQIIKQLTSNALLIKSAEKNGLAVSNRELAQEIYSTPAFLTDGRFDPEKYQNRLNGLRVDKLKYESDLQENLLNQKYFRFVAAGALFSRQSLEDEYRRYESEMKIRVIDFDPALFSDQAKVSDDELQKYYDLHKSDFQQKSQYALNYFILNVDDVKDKVSVRDKEVTRYYEKNQQDEFTDKASFLSRHILISIPKDVTGNETEQARQKADSLYKKLIKNRGQFADLAKVHSEDPGSAKKGGDLGWVEKGSFVSEFEAVVAGLKKNEISEPFLSSFGYHIVELLDKKEERIKPFEEVKEEIEVTIRLNKSKRRLKNQVSKLISGSAEETTVQDMAASVTKKVQKTELFDDSKELAGIGFSYQIYQELKETQKNQKGQFVLPGDQGIVVYEVADIKDPFIKPLNDVTEQVRYYSLDEKKKILAQEKLTESAGKINSLDEFNGLAKNLKTKVIEISFKFSDRQIENLSVSARFKTEVFKMEKGKVSAIEDTSRGYLVFLVDKKKGVLDDKSQQALEMLENMMQKQKTEIVLNGLINQLRKDIEIDYNMPILNALNVQLDS
jgi:peptidyl-prolyl cis-trans isomerase D